MHFKIDDFDLRRGYMWSDGSLPLKDGAFPSPCSVWLSFFKKLICLFIFGHSGSALLGTGSL